MWAVCVVVIAFKEKGEITGCSCYRAVKFFVEHGMTVVDGML